MTSLAKLGTSGHHGFVTEIGFIGLDIHASAAERGYANGLHSLADAMADEPCSFESAAQDAVKLVRANAFLAGSDQVNGLQPMAHRNMAGLEYGPDLHSEGFAALVALVGADTGGLALHWANPINPAAMRAHRALRPYAGFYPSVSGCFIVKVLVRND